MKGRKAIVALDVGGSSIKSALITRDHKVPVTPIFTPIDSQASAGAILTTLSGVVEDHLAGEARLNVGGIAFAFPGPFDYEAGVCLIEGVAKYDAIFGLNIRDALHERLPYHLPIRFRNDAEAAVVGESLYGAGKSFRRVIGITLGTGLGSSFMANGRPLAEGPGVPPGGWLYPVPFHDIQADDIFSTRGLLVRFKEGGIEAPTVAQAVKEDGAAEVIAEFGADLGAFLRPFVIDFHAEAVLVLGGIANLYPLFAASLNRSLPVKALPGLLGETAPLLGAAELFWHNSSDSE